MSLGFILFIWFIIVSVFLFSSSSLLLNLVVIEIMTFMILFIFSYYTNVYVFSDYFLLTLFAIFVMEGVIGLTGLIILVSFAGTDYISTSSVLKV